MKTETLFSTFLMSTFLFASLSSAEIICSPCSVGDCQCSTTDCYSGTFGVYTASDCSGFPSVDYRAFSGRRIAWTPNQTATYYLRVFCDESNSNCIPQKVSSSSSLTTSTTATARTTTITATTTTTKAIPKSYNLYYIILAIFILLIFSLVIFLTFKKRLQR